MTADKPCSCKPGSVNNARTENVSRTKNVITTTFRCLTCLGLLVIRQSVLDPPPPKTGPQWFTKSRRYIGGIKKGILVGKGDLRMGRGWVPEAKPQHAIHSFDLMGLGEKTFCDRPFNEVIGKVTPFPLVATCLACRNNYVGRGLAAFYPPVKP